MFIGGTRQNMDDAWKCNESLGILGVREIGRYRDRTCDFVRVKAVCWFANYLICLIFRHLSLGIAMFATGKTPINMTNKHDKSG
jgi:hypothetical protein